MRLIAIFHPGRCGSTFLEKILAEAGVLHFGEIFSPNNLYNAGLLNGNWRAYSRVEDFLLAVAQIADLQLNHKSSAYSHSNKAFIEVKLNNYDLHPFSGMSDIASSKLICGGVFLYSSNYLRRYLSLFRAKESGTWHADACDTSYRPLTISPDFSMITDHDIYRLNELRLEQAVKRYRYLLEIQAGIIRELCHEQCMPFIPIKFEDLTSDNDSTARIVFDIIQRFDVSCDGTLTPDSIKEAILRVPLRKTGFSDLLEGLSQESQASLKLIDDYIDYLPGGKYDITIPTWC